MDQKIPKLEVKKWKGKATLFRLQRNCRRNEVGMIIKKKDT